MRPGETDWQRLANMTEEEIEANALSDPDNPPLSDEELACMRRVPNPKQIRERLGMTQVEFSETYEIPLGTLRDWEQRACEPDMAAKTLLRIIEQDPEGARAALERSYHAPSRKAG
jgi:putative transcriptional regulator